MRWLMDALNDLGSELLTGLAYGVVGLGLLLHGYLVIDLLTPGRLGDIVYVARSANAAVVVASGLLAIGAIVTTAILTSEDDFVRGLLGAAGYGLLGIVLLAVSFAVIDRLTPGDLGAMLTDQGWHPAALITAAAHLALGGVVAASIS
jgi:uncharacterized membrane protein YjfL (UPF0719 family)